MELLDVNVTCSFLIPKLRAREEKNGETTLCMTHVKLRQLCVVLQCQTSLRRNVDDESNTGFVGAEGDGIVVDVLGVEVMYC